MRELDINSGNFCRMIDENFSSVHGFGRLFKNPSPLKNFRSHHESKNGSFEIADWQSIKKPALRNPVAERISSTTVFFETAGIGKKILKMMTKSSFIVFCFCFNCSSLINDSKLINVSAEKITLYFWFVPKSSEISIWATSQRQEDQLVEVSRPLKSIFWEHRKHCCLFFCPESTFCISWN